MLFYLTSFKNQIDLYLKHQENRKSYDQSVAEALNAEKAWSELNDLLRQLQTKIAEAANTIRFELIIMESPRLAVTIVFF